MVVGGRAAPTCLCLACAYLTAWGQQPSISLLQERGASEAVGPEKERPISHNLLSMILNCFCLFVFVLTDHLREMPWLSVVSMSCP